MPLGFMVVDLHRLVTSPNPSGTLARVDSMIASQVSSGEGPFGSSKQHPLIFKEGFQLVVISRCPR